jgi:hypothetical protein
MAQLPRFDPAEVTTSSGLAALRSDFGELRSDSRSDIAVLRSELRGGLAAVNQRLDRLFLALLVGMFGVVAAFIGVILSVT